MGPRHNDSKVLIFPNRYLNKVQSFPDYQKWGVTGAGPPDIKVRSASMSVVESIEVFYVKNPSTEPAKFELPPL
jgi:hypothetical protein